MQSSLTRLISQLYFKDTKSSQPHLLFLFVTVPYSIPFSAIYSPTSSNNSDGNGPFPTLVEYALNIPTVW